MDVKKMAIAAAIGGLLATGMAHADGTATQDKCYGIAKAGKNDCAGNGHSCAGQAKKDNDPNEWKHVPAAQCEKMGGKTTPPAK
ncbi:MAG: DUF2282 domain-containing protein [Steroidobacteraceae bacterium]